jgi:osmotically-inducible protein OsmY
MFITTDVKMRLLADADTPGTDINVDTRNGVVTLLGKVPSAAAKAAAEADAKKVSGVTRVINDLQVVPKAKQEMVEARDDQLKDQIKSRLDQRDIDGVDVEVTNGVARLKGTVADDQQRLRPRSRPGRRRACERCATSYVRARPSATTDSPAVGSVDGTERLRCSVPFAV